MIRKIHARSETKFNGMPTTKCGFIINPVTKIAGPYELVTCMHCINGVKISTRQVNHSTREVTA